ncbi:MAG: glutathione S-transferase family protein [Tabrizicola sp.]|jgi:glutathione S-transferase|nr:glutathione S-transferase family protein [Tabrizicola sp.]
MGYRLHGRRQTGSMAIEAALELCGATWDPIDTPRPTTEAELAALHRINPRGQVPILIHPDGTVITEGPAILSHLADAFPAAGLAPAPGTSLRAWHDRWLAFYHANVYEGMLRELFPDRYTDDASGAPAVATAATTYVRRHFLIFEAEIAARPAEPFFCGPKPAILDIYLWMLCFWMNADWLGSHCPALTARWHRMRAIPGLAKIEADHFG